jgi:quinol-cytochrome oxidoreductase complex cytochrome b subunit
MGLVRAWLKDSVPIDWDRLADLTNEPVPNHLRKWWFALGGTPLYLFGVQVVTGILLSFYYVPDPDHAWNSVREITQSVSFGWYLRSIHKWSAQLMIVATALHLMRVFFTGAYRKPRELNWMVGCGLLFTTLVFGFTGYSLVYEQLSYWGATVASNLTQAVPIGGEFVANFIRGGEEVGQATLTRFFVFHIGLLPTVFVALLATHILLVRTHGVTEMSFPGEEKKRFPLVPDHVMTELGIGIVLMILLTFLAVVFPAKVGPRAEPTMTPEHIKPEWYFYFTFRWLKLTSLRTGVLGTGAAAFVMLCWPFVDRLLRRRRSDSEMSMVFGVLAVLVWIALTIWEALG